MKDKIIISIFLFCTTLIASQQGFAFQNHGPSVCQKAAYLTLNVCKLENKQDLLSTKATCLNLSSPSDRNRCLQQSQEAVSEGFGLCVRQYFARASLCDQLEEQRYDPTDFWKPENFVNPLEIGDSIAPNPYFPLTEGITVLEGDGEVITLTVRPETKLINGVNCIVLNDLVNDEDQAMEDTDDWYAQDIEGNVWYCGEISKNYKVFEGDNPPFAELLHIKGSWKSFRDGALPGIKMPAFPSLGHTYRQEFVLGKSEDAAQVIATSVSSILESDFCEENELEIRHAVENLCEGDCIVTKEFTPVEPEVTEHKYYAPGYGLILETDLEGGCVAIATE